MKGILFTSDMIRAIREGRKTVTRRLDGLKEINEHPDEWTPVAVIEDSWVIQDWEFWRGNTLVDVKPRYRVGEAVYVKELWAPCDCGHCPGYIYKADGIPSLNPPVHWHSPLFMPEKAARTFRKIMDVRPERLWDISESDVLAEGCWQVNPSHEQWKWRASDEITGVTARECYARLWDAINPSHPWKNNDWVWRIAFEAHQEGKQ